jgi:hypothetical protein
MKRTKRYEAEVKRSRKASDAEHSIDELHALAIATEVDRLHRWWQSRIELIEHAIEDYAEQVATFRDRLVANPANAFEWADSAMQASAKWEAAEQVLKLLKERGPDAVHEVIQAQTLRLARNPYRSTAMAANAMWSWRLEAWADLADDWKWRW